MKKEDDKIVYLGEAVWRLIHENCKPKTFNEVSENGDRFVGSDIRIRLNSDGSGYVHILDRDSQTINFESIDPKIKVDIGNPDAIYDAFKHHLP